MILADLDWLFTEELYLGIAAGAVVTTLAFMFGSQLFGQKAPGTESTPGKSTEKESVPTKVDPFAAGGASERRNAMRRKGSSISLQITDPKGKYPTTEGWVLDRSVTGLGVIVDRPVDAGTILRVKPENAPPLTPLLDIEVRSCKPYETDFHLGCVFVKTPPYSVLMLFG
jgi:hypothetical protein